MEYLQHAATRDGPIILDATYLVASASVRPEVFAIGIINRPVYKQRRLKTGLD